MNSFNRRLPNTPKAKVKNTRSRVKATRDITVLHNGRLYYSTLPPGSQKDARRIFRMLKRHEPNYEKLYFKEIELHNLSYIYPRLYQIPGKSQQRLRTWIVENKATIQDWELGDFLKTYTADIVEDTRPKTPGCPHKAIRAWKQSCNSGQKPLANGNGDGNRMMPLLATQTFKRRPMTTELSPTTSADFPQSPQMNEVGYNLIRNEDREQRCVGAQHSQKETFVLDPNNASAITQEYQNNPSCGPGIAVNPNDSDITQEYQNNENYSLEYPLLGPLGEPIGIFDQSLNTALLNQYQPYRGEALTYSPSEQQHGQVEECNRGVLPSYANEEHYDDAEDCNDELLDEFFDFELYDHMQYWRILAGEVDGEFGKIQVLGGVEGFTQWEATEEQQDEAAL